MNESLQEKINESLMDRLTRIENKIITLELIVKSLDSLDLDKRIRKLENKLDIKKVI
jgi:hypothetical protein